MLRLPNGMRDRIRREAEANNRSMNAEIIARLQETFDSVMVDRRVLEALAEDMLTEVRKRLDRDGLGTAATGSKDDVGGE